VLRSAGAFWISGIERWPVPECGNLGNGCFGHWVVEPEGPPAYPYEMDHVSDPWAAYSTPVSVLVGHSGGKHD
jgi:hypothetical protein